SNPLPYSHHMYRPIRMVAVGSTMRNRLSRCDGGVSLSVVSSSDDKNGKTAGNGGGVIAGVVSGIVVGIVPNKITRPVGVLTLSSNESDEAEVTEMAITYTGKVHINHIYINHA
nr:hypothetical protein [Tanacetum cinerariifolium]